MAVKLNEPPPVEQFCVEYNPPPDGTGVLRLIGGFDMQSQINPNQGPPGSCGLSLDLMGNLQSILAVFQPLFDVIDLVAQIAAITQLIADCLTNPLKLVDLIVALLNVTGKVNKVLALVPPLPQGLLRAIAMALDLLRACIAQLDCLVNVLVSINGELTRLAELTEQLNSIDDDQLRAQMEEQLVCATENTQQKVDAAAAAFGPVARLLCFVRALLIMADPKDEKGLKTIAQQLQIPDTTQLDILQDVIDVLQVVRDILVTAIEAIQLIGTPLGLAPPDLIFKCPLDDEDNAPQTPPPQPAIQTITLPDGAPLLTVPQAATVDDAAFQVLITGGGFFEASKVFWNASQIDASLIQVLSPRQLLASVPGALRLNVGKFQMSVANEPTGGAPAFSGISSVFGQLGETDIKISELYELEVA